MHLLYQELNKTKNDYISIIIFIFNLQVLPMLVPLVGVPRFLLTRHMDPSLQLLLLLRMS